MLNQRKRFHYMGRRTRTASAEARPAQALKRPDRIVQRALNLPRAGRVLLAGLFGVATTLAFMPLVDGVYLAHLLAWQTPMLPALFSSGLGMAVYIAGWRLLVGTVGERPALGRATALYFWFGVLMCLFVLALVLYGLALNAQAD